MAQKANRYGPATGPRSMSRLAEYAQRGVKLAASVTTLS